MKEAIQRRRPETRIDGSPQWFHPHGSGMQVAVYDRNNSVLVIQSAQGTDVEPAERVAKLRISRVGGGDWKLDWDIFHVFPEKVRGYVIFTTEELQAAFGLSAFSGEDGDHLISRYGAESAKVGKFIRWQEYLNIPCPGTGNNGDPNLSILITDEMKVTLQELISCTG
ncbi:MAG: hypothetical protein ACHQU0_01865 [Candidatus Paceibacteria bacterium]